MLTSPKWWATILSRAFNESVRIKELFVLTARYDTMTCQAADWRSDWSWKLKVLQCYTQALSLFEMQLKMLNISELIDRQTDLQFQMPELSLSNLRAGELHVCLFIHCGWQLQSSGTTLASTSSKQLTATVAPKHPKRFITFNPDWKCCCHLLSVSQVIANFGTVRQSLAGAFLGPSRCFPLPHVAHLQSAAARPRSSVHLKSD